MFFFLSKTLDVVFSPLAWSLAALLGAVLAWHRRTLAGALVLLAIVVLYASSIRAVSNRLVAFVERPARTTLKRDVEYDAVILLGGMLDQAATSRSGAPAYTDSVERLLTTYDLLRTRRARAVLITGGDPDAAAQDVIEARVLARQLESWGIGRERIVVEDRSLNTRENALFSKALVESKGWRKLVLVTSAAHMPRAEGCFRAVGLRPDTLAVDFHADRAPVPAEGYLPRAKTLAATEQALRELTGRIVYRVRGYSVP